MKKLFQNRTVALVVLIVAVVLGIIIGQIRKPAALPKINYGSWICDSANMLSAETEKTLADYNGNWNQRYGSVIAVATVKSIKGWESNTFADTLGKQWGLGEKDMLLLIYPKETGVDYWVAQGAYLQENQMDSQQNALKAAIENEIYTGGAERGAVALFQQADVFFAQVLGQPTWNQTAADTTQWRDRSGVSVFKVILLIIGIIVVWAIIDRIRYGRYRRRVAVNPMPAVSYYPIFWGRPTRAVPPSQPGVYHTPARPSRPTGTFHVTKPGANHSTVRPANRPSTPVKPTVTKPGNANRPGGFGKGGFGGGKR